MARVLIGWELGANRGHVNVMQIIAQRLLAERHEVHFALQQIDAAGLDHDRRIGLWQAPVWPRLLIGQSRHYATPSVSMGDILGRVGLDRPGALAAMIAGWDSILAQLQPDLVVANFAPALLAAARGRIETVVNGNGFSCPAAGLAAFPALARGQPALDEAELLDIADADLRAAGREPLASLPALFAADHQAIGSFALLDPYRDSRSQPLCAPIIGLDTGIAANPDGQEVFVYFYHLAPADAPLWDGLARSGRTVRIHVPHPTRDHLAAFGRFGFAFEKHPLPFAHIAARSRLALSHGGQGFVSSCLLTGLPQIIAWYDLEKKLAGRAVSQAALGCDFEFQALSAVEIAEIIDAAWADAAIHGRAAAARPEFAAAMGDRVENRIAELANR